MSANKKKNKDEGPKLAGLIAAGFSMAFIGGLCGFLYLTAFPPKAYSSVSAREEAAEAASAPPKPGDAFYFSGSDGQGARWEAKRSAVLQAGPGPVEITSDELNAWMRNRFRPTPTPRGEDAPNVAIVPKIPEFFVAGGDALYMTLPTELSVFGELRRYVIFAKGHFEADSEVEYVVDELHINSAQIPAAGGIANRIFMTLVQAYSASDEFTEIQDAWADIASIELVANGMRVQFRE